MTNPFLSLWLSQANAWSGAMRGFWTGELQRHQTQMLNEMTRQAWRFWTGGWMIPPTVSRGAPPRRSGGRR
jgi:hypothetical protein